MPGNDYTNKNPEEFEAKMQKDEKKVKIITATIGKIAGFIAILISIYLYYCIKNDHSVEGISGFAMAIVLLPAIIIFASVNIVTSAIRIKKLDIIGWFLLFLNPLIWFLFLAIISLIKKFLN